MDGFQEGSSSLHLQRSTFSLCVAARRSIANFYQPGTTKGPAGVLGRLFQVVNSRENRFCAITAYGFTDKEMWSPCHSQNQVVGVDVTIDDGWSLFKLSMNSFVNCAVSVCRISTLSGMPHKLIPHIACPLTSLSFHWSYCWWRSNPFFPSVFYETPCEL